MEGRVRYLIDLPRDALGHVLCRLLLAHDIAYTATTCRSFADAVRASALKLRPFPRDIVILNCNTEVNLDFGALDNFGHEERAVLSIAVVGAHVITSDSDGFIRVWRDGTCVSLMEAHFGVFDDGHRAQVMWPQGPDWLDEPFEAIPAPVALRDRGDREVTPCTVVALPDGRLLSVYDDPDPTTMQPPRHPMQPPRGRGVVLLGNFDTNGFDFVGDIDHGFVVDYKVTCIAALPQALPNGAHLLVAGGTDVNEEEVDDDGNPLDGNRTYEIGMYTVDGTRIDALTRGDDVLVGTNYEEIYGHDYPVRAMVVTRDGEYVISAGGREAIVWSVATTRPVTCCSDLYTDNASSMCAVAVTPDGKRLLSGSAGHVGGAGFDASAPDVRVWLIHERTEFQFAGANMAKPKNIFHGLISGDMCALVAMPDNQHALSGSGDMTVKLFNVNDGAIVRT